MNMALEKAAALGPWREWSDAAAQQPELTQPSRGPSRVPMPMQIRMSASSSQIQTESCCVCICGPVCYSHVSLPTGGLRYKEFATQYYRNHAHRATCSAPDNGCATRVRLDAKPDLQVPRVPHAKIESQCASDLRYPKITSSTAVQANQPRCIGPCKFCRAHCVLTRTELQDLSLSHL